MSEVEEQFTGEGPTEKEAEALALMAAAQSLGGPQNIPVKRIDYASTTNEDGQPWFIAVVRLIRPEFRSD